MSQKLLIVDDEPGIVAVVQNYFEMAGYLVITAYNGKDALKKLSQAPDTRPFHKFLSTAKSLLSFNRQSNILVL